MWHPWRRLGALPQLTLRLCALPDGLAAATDGRSIYLSRTLNQAERRCALTHELIHFELGHTTDCAPRDETYVRQATARRLIPLDRLIDVAHWTDSLDEAADELWVTRAVLDDRLAHLHPSELAALRAAMS